MFFLSNKSPNFVTHTLETWIKDRNGGEFKLRCLAVLFLVMSGSFKLRCLAILFLVMSGSILSHRKGQWWDKILSSHRMDIDTGALNDANCLLHLLLCKTSNVTFEEPN